MWPAKSDSVVSGAEGWIHIFGLGYDWAIPALMPETTEQLLHLSADFVYNSGTARLNVDHDWSHAVLGVSTDFDIANNLTFTPGLYYQLSMDDSINPDDETWVSLSMKYKF